MKANELHTVFIEEGQTASWFIYESAASTEYDGVTYANHDLKKWEAEGLYKKPSKDEV